MIKNTLFAALIAILISVGVPVEAGPNDVQSTEIANWIQELGSPRFQVREAATNHLRAAGEKAVDPLLAVLEDVDRERARRAKSILHSFLNERDLGELVGVWNYVTVKLEGKEEASPGGQLRITEKSMVIRKASGKEPYGLMPFTIDATMSPKHLDFFYKNEPIRCLYVLNGDALTLCYSKDSGDVRPAKIWCEPGSGTRLHVLKRVVEE